MFRQLDYKLKTILILAFFAGFLSFASNVLYAQSGWMMWLDGRSKGVVPVYHSGRIDMVSIGTMARALNFEVFPRDGSLIIKKDNNRIQVMQNAAAVWFNVKLVPMAAEAVLEDNRWWIDSASSIKIMTMLLNSGGGNHVLKWGGGGEVPSPDSQPDVKPVAGTEKETEKDAFLKEIRKETKLPLLNSIRWGDHGSIIRVVMDLRGSEIPRPNVSSNQVTIRFGYSPSFQMSDLSSPYPSVVNTAITHSGKDMIIYFKHVCPEVEHFVLENPRRLVMDFPKSGFLKVTVPADPVKNIEVLPPPQGMDSSIQPDKKLVVIDPGHGGKDPGAVANGLREKDVNLQISKILAAELKAKGIPVKLTRNDDRYLKLSERTDLANRWGASIFVSIHANALPPGRHAKGMEIYLMALPTDKDAMRLALIENKELSNGNGDGNNMKVSDERTRMLLSILGNMQQNAKIDQSTTVAEVMFDWGKRRGLLMRRVAQAPFFVLRGAGMPSVLVETGFLTEPKEARMLASPAYQKQLAQALARGIIDYLEKS